MAQLIGSKMNKGLRIEISKNLEAFWAKKAEQFLHFSTPYHSILSGSLSEGNVRWFDGGYLNACDLALDRHLATQADKIAFIVEPNEPGEAKKITYRALHQLVCRFANLLRDKGLNKGDRVCIYMPMMIEAVAAMLACARLGMIHSVVFAGFSAEALKDRIHDAQCKAVITADDVIRGEKHIPLKETLDQIIDQCNSVQHVFFVRHSGRKTSLKSKDIIVNDVLNDYSDHCDCVPMAAEDPLFILYTSGSTGKPKGIMHTTAGYLLYAATTFHDVFDHQPNDIYWCTADIGWITGHSYLTYGPLLNAATSVLFEGVPNYPNASRIWEIVDKHQISILYTAPTLIRMLMAAGDHYLKGTERKSLRILGTVGEPINPAAWQWYHDEARLGHCPIVDTWWQTETGGIMITPLPSEKHLKPGAAMKPFFGIEAKILDQDGKELDGEAEGLLVIQSPWPGMLRGIYGDSKRFHETYLAPYPGYYFTGDGARRDQDGDIWIIGRVDDVINVSGHRIGTAEIESALTTHPQISEAAVVGFPHDTKGEGIYAFIVPKQGEALSEEIHHELKSCVKKLIGGFAAPDVIKITRDLPKTRSGKIMRRILRKIAAGNTNDLGDTSTLADPGVIDALLKF